MKLIEMLEIKDCRQNAVGFLHYTDHSAMREMLNIEFESSISFYDLCDLILLSKEKKQISHKIASACFKILQGANKLIRTDQYRLENHNLYVYDTEQKAYIYNRKCTQRELNALIKKNGKYID